MSHCNIGVLASPFMRAALVIDVDPFTVSTTPIRPARYYSNFKDGRFSRLIQPRLSPTWIVPTRNPEALSKAIEAFPAYRGSARVRQPSCGAGCLALAEGIPITDVSRWLGHNSIEVTTRSTDTSYPAPSTAPAPPSTPSTTRTEASSDPGKTVLNPC